MVSKTSFATDLELLRLLEEECNRRGVLEDAAGGCGGGGGDRDGVTLGGEREGVGGADAVSAAASEKQGEAHEGESEEPCCCAIAARAKSWSCDREYQKCPGDGRMVWVAF
jgi:hypothetical protein